MDSTPGTPQSTSRYELRFRSLFDDGRAFAFPCDADGQVDFAAMSERARRSYHHARAMVGRELSMPSIQARFH